MMRMGGKLSSPPAALWLISRDESIPNYVVLYYDVRSVSRVYEMSFAGWGVEAVAGRTRLLAALRGPTSP